MKLEVNLIEELLSNLNKQPELSRQQILVEVLGVLYETGQVSGIAGARILGCNLQEFYSLLLNNGFAVEDSFEEENEEISSLESFRRGWKEGRRGETLPISQLWEDINIVLE